MRSIDVYGLIQRECDITVNDRAVNSAVKICDGHLRKAGDELLDVADPLGSTGWLTRARAVPEAQVLNGMSCHRGLREKLIGRTIEYSKPFHSSSVNKPQNLEEPSATVLNNPLV